MSEPIAATIPPSPPAAGDTPAAPAPAPASNTNSHLPEGVELKNTTEGVDAFFDAHQKELAAQSGAPLPPAAAPAAPPAAPATKPAPTPGSVAAQLAAKAKPAVPVPPAAAPAPGTNPEDVVAKVEAEFIRHNPKWKPAEGWNVLKTSLKTESERRTALEKELAETKAKLTTPGAAGITVQEVEELRAREKAASDRLLVMDLESHPQFKAQFVDPKNAEIGRATELLKAHNVTVDVAALIGKPRAELGRAVNDALKDVPEFDRVEIAEAIRKAHAIHEGGKSALVNSRQLATALQVQSVERQRAAFGKRWAPVSAAIGEFVQPIETPADATPEQRAADEAYNADVRSLQQKAEAIALQPANDEQIADHAIKAAAYDLHINRVLPRIVSEYEVVVNLNRQLTAELTALKGRNPNHSIRPSPGAGDTPPTDPSQMTHAQAAEHFHSKQ